MNHSSLISVALPFLVASCVVSAEPGDVDVERTARTGLELRVDFLADSDIATLRFEATPVACDENGGGPIGPTQTFDQELEELLLPGPIESLENKPFAKDSGHMFADRFFALDPGCYDVAATPLNLAGRASLDCAPAAQKGVHVAAARTLELTLISQCRSDGRGARDGLSVLNHPPEILDPELAGGQTLALCQAAELCATVFDPDSNPMELVWSASTAEGVAATPIVTSSTSRRRGEVTECVSFTPNQAGDLAVTLRAFDLLNRDQTRMRFEDWLKQEGYPHNSRAEYVFSFQVASDGPC